ncbi:hypothetical protein V1478_015544 [Vespula squamosa]|uniref:Uncharacterized protein n=1 Tax=Vespula squamosa TaxID=30214 RepID=A0ABD2A145_VESSQ
MPMYVINLNKKREKYINTADRHVNNQYSRVNINNVSKLLEITSKISCTVAIQVEKFGIICNRLDDICNRQIRHTFRECGNVEVAK